MKPIERIILFALPALLLGILFVRPIIDTDLFWQLKTGDYIIETGSMPDKDPFAYTSKDAPLVNSYWVSQIAFSLLYRFSGFEGLTLFVVFISLCPLLVFYKLDVSRRNPALFSLLFFMAIMASSERFHLRPTMFTLLFAAIYIYVLENRAPDKKLFPMILALQVLWTNMHSGFLLGVFIVGAYSIERWKPLSLKQLVSVMVMPLLTLACCFINPWGVDLLAVQLGIITDSWALREWLPLLMKPTPYISVLASVAVLALLGAVSFALNIKKPRIAHILIFIVLLAATLKSRRFLELFPVLGIPFIIYGFDRKIFPSVRLNRILFALIVLAHVWLYSSIYSGKYYLADANRGSPGIGVNGAIFPVLAADMLLTEDLKGVLFNNYDIGGYLIWRLYPKKKVFIDGRVYPYGDDFLFYYMDLINDPAKWEKAAAKYGFDIVILSHYPTENLTLASHLHKSADWAMIGFDAGGSLFVRHGSGNDKAIEKYSINLAERKPTDKVSKTPEGFPLSYWNLAEFYSALGYKELAIAEYKAALEIKPDFAPFHNNLGVIYLEANQHEAAKFEFRLALKQGSKNADAHYNLGYVYLLDREYEKAIPQFEAALEIEPGFKNALVNLGKISGDMGDYEAAADYFRRALKAAPDDLTASYNLAVILEKADRGQALEQWRKVLVILEKRNAPQIQIEMAKKRIQALDSRP